MQEEPCGRARRAVSLAKGGDCPNRLANVRELVLGLLGRIAEGKDHSWDALTVGVDDRTLHGVVQRVHVARAKVANAVHARKEPLDRRLASDMSEGLFGGAMLALYVLQANASARLAELGKNVVLIVVVHSEKMCV